MEYVAGEIVWSPKGGSGIAQEDQQQGIVEAHVVKGNNMQAFNDTARL